MDLSGIPKVELLGPFLLLDAYVLFEYMYRGRIHKRNWDKSVESFPPCYTPPPPPEQKWFETGL